MCIRDSCNIIDEQRRKKKEELEKAETELAQTRREIKTDKLKGVAVDATDVYKRQRLDQGLGNPFRRAYETRTAG